MLKFFLLLLGGDTRHGFVHTRGGGGDAPVCCNKLWTCSPKDFNVTHGNHRGVNWEVEVAFAKFQGGEDFMTRAGNDAPGRRNND